MPVLVTAPNCIKPVPFLIVALFVTEANVPVEPNVKLPLTVNAPAALASNAPLTVVAVLIVFVAVPPPLNVKLPL